ncbi:MAG: ATP-binding protein [Pirellulaceae bacterium]
MLDDNELDQLLNDLESDRVEWKESISDTGRIRQAVCAFANDMPGHGLPGVVFVGVQDDGTCANLPITDQLLLTLSDMRSDGNILPLPAMTVQKRVISGCELAVIEVEPSRYPPVKYNGRIWIRVGPRRATANEQEEQILIERRRAGNLPWDLQPIEPATIDDLDLDLFQREYLPSAVATDILDQNQRTIEQQLASLRLLSTDMSTPTVAGLLAVGKSPADYLPGAYIQFLRIDGDALTDPIADQKTLHGLLIELIPQLDAILTANIHIATDVTSSARESRRPDYPIAALQQLTRNAVMHRNYESSNAPVRITWFNDRIEIQNPGGPFGQVTVETFGQPGVTDYRNPTVAEVMRSLDFVQRFGVGISIARQELVDNGNPELELVADVNHVLAIVRKSS